MAQEYTVVKGDTIAKIASRLGVSASSILSLNPELKSGNLILIGQKLKVPTVNSGGTTTVNSTSGKTSSGAWVDPDQTEVYFTPQPSGSSSSYTPTSTKWVDPDQEEVSFFVSYKRGDKGQRVKEFQQALISLNYDLGSSGADGIFGAKTEAAVKDFQKRNNIKTTGVIDIETARAISGTGAITGVTYIPAPGITVGDYSNQYVYGDAAVPPYNSGGAPYSSTIPSAPTPSTTTGSSYGSVDWGSPAATANYWDNVTTVSFQPGGATGIYPSSSNPSGQKMYILNKTLGFWMPLPGYPQEVSDSAAANFEQQEVVGRSSPYHGYSSTSARTVSISLITHRDILAQLGLQKLPAFVQSLAYPKYLAQEIKSPEVVLKLGNTLYISGVPSECNVNWAAPVTKDGHYTVCTINLTIEENVDKAYDSSYVISKGGMRN